MKYYLFLDDERKIYDVKWAQLPYDDTEWLYAKSYGQFVDIVMDLGLPEFVSFDHDLADYHYKVSSMENEHSEYGDFTNRQFNYGPEKTGLDAAKWLIEYSKSTGHDLPQCYTHSANPIGCCHIMGYINLYLIFRTNNCI